MAVMTHEADGIRLELEAPLLPVAVSGTQTLHAADKAPNRPSPDPLSPAPPPASSPAVRSHGTATVALAGAGLVASVDLSRRLKTPYSSFKPARRATPAAACLAHSARDDQVWDLWWRATPSVRADPWAVWCAAQMGCTIPLLLLLALTLPAHAAAVALASGPTCAGSGNATTVYAVFNGASASSGTVSAGDITAAAGLLAGYATGVSSQTCSFTTTANQFNCTGLSLTMGETCSGLNSPVSGSVTQLASSNTGVFLCGAGNLVTLAYSYTTSQCGTTMGMPIYCSGNHSTYATTSATQAVLVNPYDLATATQKLAIPAMGMGSPAYLTLPGGAQSYVAGAVGTAANGTCVVNGTDNVACYGAQVPPGYGCYMNGGSSMVAAFGTVASCSTLPGTVSPGGVCQLCPPGQVIADSTLTSCMAGTPAPVTPPAQCAGLVHRWGPAVSVVSGPTGTIVSDAVAGGPSLTLSANTSYQPAAGALQMQGVSLIVVNGLSGKTAQSARYIGNASLLGTQPLSGFTLVRCHVPMPAAHCERV